MGTHNGPAELHLKGGAQIPVTAKVTFHSLGASRTVSGIVESDDYSALAGAFSSDVSYLKIGGKSYRGTVSLNAGVFEFTGMPSSDG